MQSVQAMNFNSHLILQPSRPGAARLSCQRHQRPPVSPPVQQCELVYEC